MGIFKKIAQDPSEGQGKTKTCTSCGGKGIMTVPALPGETDKNGDFWPGAPAKSAECVWCHGTGRMHV